LRVAQQLLQKSRIDLALIVGLPGIEVLALSLNVGPVETLVAAIILELLLSSRLLQLSKQVLIYVPPVAGFKLPSYLLLQIIDLTVARMILLSAALQICQALLFQPLSLIEESWIKLLPRIMR